MSVGSLLSFLFALPTFIVPMHMFPDFAEKQHLGMTAWNDIREFLSREEIPEESDKIKLGEIRGNLVLSNIRFSYNATTEPPVLAIDNIVIGEGEMIGISGPSGAGKSTFN